MSAEEPVFVPERRLAPAAAVLVSMGLPLLLPPHLEPGPVWVLIAGQGLLLIAVVVADPGRIDRRTHLARLLSLALVVGVALIAAWGTGRLVYDLLQETPGSDEAGELLVAGGVVWLETIIAFSLFYWEIDGGGPAARAFSIPKFPGIAFPQHMNPELAPPGWRPLFGDYAYLGLTNSLAFSPTDAMPLAPWAKATLALQSGISLLILSLVIATSVNLLG